MLDYKTDVRGARTQPQSAEDLLEERRAYFYRLVDQVFDPKDPQGRDISRTELAGLTLHELLGMYAAMRTSREIDMMRDGSLPSRRPMRRSPDLVGRVPSHMAATARVGERGSIRVGTAAAKHGSPSRGCPATHEFTSRRRATSVARCKAGKFL